MNFQSKVSILFSICFLTRLCFVGRYLDSCDSIDFALGLHDYDLSLLQPHFPGYPVYMVASSLFFKLSHQDVWSLVMPGVLFGSITMYPLSFLTRQLFSERVAILTAVPLPYQPPLLVAGGKTYLRCYGSFLCNVSRLFFVLCV